MAHYPQELGWQNYWRENSGILRTREGVAEQIGVWQFQMWHFCHKAYEKFTGDCEFSALHLLCLPTGFAVQLMLLEAGCVWSLVFAIAWPQHTCGAAAAGFQPELQCLELLSSAVAPCQAPLQICWRWHGPQGSGSCGYVLLSALTKPCCPVLIKQLGKHCQDWSWFSCARPGTTDVSHGR